MTALKAATSQGTESNRATEMIRRNVTLSGVRDRKRDLAELAATSDDPEIRYELAGLSYISYEFETARSAAEAAFLGFKRNGLRRRAAVAAALLGRIFFEGLDNRPAANGWFGRARTMLEGEGACVERGWVLVGLVACSVGDAGTLIDDAREALEIARRLGDAELECKALADGGLAAISVGEMSRGLEMIDEAMAMLSCGEVSYFVAAQVFCDTVTACERSGEIGRLESWLDVVDAAPAGPDDLRPAMFSHCHVAYGNVLCRVGRWRDAESALRLGVATSREGFGYHRIGSRAGLAELRVRQGRLDEARLLLDGCTDRVEAVSARAHLYHAEERFDEAVRIINRGLRELGTQDRTRAIPLLALRIESELALGDVAGARAALADLERRSAQTSRASFGAYAALARGRLSMAEGDPAAAAEEFERGLGEISGDRVPLLEAELHLALAEILAERDPRRAEADARAAFETYNDLGAPEADRCRQLLQQLGYSAVTQRRPQSPLDELSPREMEVLQLLGRGRSNPEIAQQLFISRKTAEHHVGAVLRKLGLRNRTEAAAYTMLLGNPDLLDGRGAFA